MKTYDRQEVKKGRIYYRILSYTYDGNSLTPIPSITKVKCENVFRRGHKFFRIEYARFCPGCEGLLKSCEIKKQIFHSFDSAKRICLKRAKILQRNIDKAVDQLEGLTKKELKNDSNT